MALMIATDMANSTQPNPKILIIGGGFGGVRAALKLSKQQGYDVTLISNVDHFAYYPQFYHTATGGVESQVAIPLSQIFGHTSVKVVKDVIVSIDPAAHTVSSNDGKTTYPYDELILALGNITNYFGIKGLAEFSFGIKSVETVRAFKKHLHEQVLNYDPAQSYVVIGGGPTGIELAAELGKYLNHLTKMHNLEPRKYDIQLVEAMPRLLPRSQEAVSASAKKRLESLGVKVLVSAAVKGQTADALQFETSAITTRTVVWTSGVAVNPFYNANGAHFQLFKNGKVMVSDHLEGKEHVYVLGDNALTPYSGLAQTALHDADYVAADIVRARSGAARPAYKAFMPVNVLPVGPNWAIAEWGKLHLSGFLAHLLRVAADLIGYSDVLPIPAAVKIWLQGFRSEDTCPYCDTTKAATTEATEPAPANPTK